MHSLKLKTFHTDFKKAIAGEPFNDISAEVSYKHMLRNLDKRYNKACINNFPEDLQQAIKKCDLFHDSFFIYGPCGDGKTHLATAILREYCLQCVENYNPPCPDYNDIIMGYLDLDKDITIPPTYIDAGTVNFHKLAVDVKSSFSGNNQTMSELLAPHIQGYRIIDDIGGKPTGSAIETLYYIVETRYNFMPTVYTSNLTLTEIAEIYDPRIANRLLSCKHIKMGDTDYRLLNHPEL
jgi:DNA replication protein DnaC